MINLFVYYLLLTVRDACTDAAAKAAVAAIKVGDMVKISFSYEEILAFTASSAITATVSIYAKKAE